MTTQTVKLIDKSGTVIATGQVFEEGDHLGGIVDLRTTPASVRAVFEEFEEIVNGQMLSFLDDIQDRITGLSIKAVFDDGSATDIKDLQVYPSSGEVSFKLAERSVHNGCLPTQETAPKR